MKLQINLFDHDSIKRAREAVEKYRDEFPQKMEQFIMELAEEGAKAIRTAYSSSNYVGDLPTVSVQKTEHGAVIVAEGKSVAFIEFGTGIGIKTQQQSIGIDTSPGSWSQSELGKHQFIPGSHEYWVYKGQTITGSDAADGFIRAVEVIKSNEEAIARRIFG